MSIPHVNSPEEDVPTTATNSTNKMPDKEVMPLITFEELRMRLERLSEKFFPETSRTMPLVGIKHTYQSEDFQAYDRAYNQGAKTQRDADLKVLGEKMDALAAYYAEVIAQLEAKEKEWASTIRSSYNKALIGMEALPGKVK